MLKVVEDAITKILPAEVYVCCKLINDDNGELFDVEMEFIKNAVEKRVMEFTAGRIAVRNILEKIGYKNFPILQGKLREPVWPSELSGSITHDGDYCIVAISYKSKVSLLGIDLTTDKKLDRDLVNLICTEDEIIFIESRDAQFKNIDIYKLIFSIKESIYKCLFPLVGEIFDFHDVCVFIQPSEGSVSIKLKDISVFDNLDINLNITYCLIGDYIFTVAWNR